MDLEVATTADLPVIIAQFLAANQYSKSLSFIFVR